MKEGLALFNLQDAEVALDLETKSLKGWCLYYHYRKKLERESL